MRKDHLLINCSLPIKERNEYNLFHRFCLIDFLLYWRLQRLLMHAFVFCDWIEVMNSALITFNHTFHRIRLIVSYFQPLATNLNMVVLSVFELGSEEPSKQRYSTFSTTRAESYGQTILKYPEVEVFEQWSDDLLEIQLQLYPPSPLCKCSIVEQHGEAMQWLLSV